NPGFYTQLSFYTCVRGDQERAGLRVFSEHCLENCDLVVGERRHDARKKFGMRLFGRRCSLRFDGNRRNRREEQQEGAYQDGIHLNSLCHKHEGVLKRKLKFVHPGWYRDIGGLRGCRRRNGQEHNKTASLPRCTLHVHGSVVDLRNPGDEAQTQTQTTLRTR
ncbi:MAG: hypothetical protein JWO48_1184, partial [Bryobacterales bacterium]|nr:hypothetical protein [Bryobacterales bacterium]